MLVFFPFIEEICTSVEFNPNLAIIPQQFIWSFRGVYQHPPENEHEDCFWFLWEVILKSFKEKQSTQKLLQPLLNEITLSIFWGLQTGVQDESVSSPTFIDVWNLINEINGIFLNQLIEENSESPSFSATQHLKNLSN